jgi:hypothetical protein
MRVTKCEPCAAGKGIARRARLLAIAALLALSVTAAKSASAQDFRSTDLSPVEVTLRKFNDPDPGHKIILRLPRAAITYANGYDSRRLSQIPDAIETDNLRLSLTYPDGDPLSVQARDEARKQGISEGATRTALRAKEYSAFLGYSPPDNPWEERVRDGLSDLTIVDRYEGLPHAKADIYVGQSGGDEFLELRCYPRATSIYFCTANMLVGRIPSGTLVTQVGFPDFRFHGGRVYANDRTRRLRQIICRFVVPAC